MSVIKWCVFIVACYGVGCSETAVIRPPVDTVGFLADLSKIDSQSVEILVQTANIEGSIGEIATQQKRIADALETLKASLVSSDPQGKESDPASRTAPGNNANDSQTATMIVAAPGAVRLIVSLADFACAPCDRLKRAVDTGEFKGFAVEYSEDWKPRAYPAIRYPTASSPTGWAVMYGYDAATVSRLRTATNPVVMQVKNTKRIVPQESLVATHNRLHGGGSWTWPGSTQQSLANHLRDSHGVNLASQGVSTNRGSSCPGGVCPTSPRTGRRGLFGFRR